MTVKDLAVYWVAWIWQVCSSFADGVGYIVLTNGFYIALIDSKNGWVFFSRQILAIALELIDPHLIRETFL